VPPVRVTTHSSPTATVPSSVTVADESTMATPPSSRAVVVRFTVAGSATSCCRPSGPPAAGRPCRTKPLARLTICRTALPPDGVTVTS
jgi:hypothetical protein